MGIKYYFKNLKASLYFSRTVSALPALFSAVRRSAAAAGVQEHARVLLFLLPPHCLCRDGGSSSVGSAPSCARKVAGWNTGMREKMEGGAC